MDPVLIAGLTAAIVVLAALYSAVGHGGASGYLAAMALMGLAPAAMKPTALALNLLVASLALGRFARREGFSWRTFVLFAAPSVPFAFLGGRVLPPDRVYFAVVSVALAVAAVRLLQGTQAGLAPRTMRVVPLAGGLAWGSAIGFLSGLTGVGGGIFLNPLLQLTGWAPPRKAAAVVAAFVLVNSVSGLAGTWSAAASIPSALAVWAPAALVGGWLGTGLGTRRLDTSVLHRALAGILLLAAVRLAIDAVL